MKVLACIDWNAKGAIDTEKLPALAGKFPNPDMIWHCPTSATTKGGGCDHQSSMGPLSGPS